LIDKLWSAPAERSGDGALDWLSSFVQTRTPQPELQIQSGVALPLPPHSKSTGTRLVLTLLHELSRRGGRYGLATACIGGGQGIAIICERV